MKRVAKIAVSMPAETLRNLERARLRLGRSRSALVAEAVDAWLASSVVSAEDRRYAEGYLKHPERADELAESAAIAAAAVATWDPWK